MDINIVKDLVETTLKEINYELVSISYQKEKDDYFLHIVVDRDEPISMNDIIEVTNILSSKLDECSELSNPYMLDICSQGPEKEIDVSKLEKYLGKHLELTLKEPIKNEFKYVGDLKEVNENEIVLFFFLKGAKKNLKIERSNINKAKIIVKI